jgi:hypothetical protein
VEIQPIGKIGSPVERGAGEVVAPGLCAVCRPGSGRRASKSKQQSRAGAGAAGVSLAGQGT